MGTLSTIADRLGLWESLAEGGPATSAEFADRARINERYAREWLAAMACHGYIAYDDGTKRFRMPPEQAFVLVDADSPFYLGSLFPMAPAYWRNLDLLTEAFQHGGGVPQETYGDEFWCGFERFTRTGFRNNLAQDWVPAMPQADAALRAGGAVADIGCGNGQALLFLAQGYPDAPWSATTTTRPPSRRPTPTPRRPGWPTGCATRSATWRGASRHLRPDHHVRRGPRHAPPAARRWRRSRRSSPTAPTSCWSSTSPATCKQNIDHPMGIGAFGYSASANYCMTQALAVGGEGTGTCMGEEKMRELAAEAGFTHFRRLDFPQNPFNLFYEIRN